MKQVYKTTYPTGKIYIGKDSIGSFRYTNRLSAMRRQRSRTGCSI